MRRLHRQEHKELEDLQCGGREEMEHRDKQECPEADDRHETHLEL